MNTPEFIIYENCCYKHHFECEKAEKAFDKYNESKIKGGEMCPLCRAKLFND